MLDPKNSAVWLKLKSLDMESIAYKLASHDEGEGWEFLKVKTNIDKYRMFLYLNFTHSECCIVPTLEIDKVWHYHILDTLKYHEDCENIFGYYLHHFPYFGSRGAEDRENMIDAHQQTKLLFWNEFGLEMEDSNVSSPSVCGGGSDCFATCDRIVDVRTDYAGWVKLNQTLVRPRLILN